MGDVTEIITRYNKFTEKVIELDLLNDIDSKPLLNVRLGFCFLSNFYDSSRHTRATT